MRPCHHHTTPGWCLNCMEDVAHSLRPILTGTITEADRQRARLVLARLGVTEPASCPELRDQLVKLTEHIGRLPSGVGGKELNMAFNEAIELLGR